MRNVLSSAWFTSRSTVDANVCWNWNGFVNDDGYAIASYQGSPHKVHRLSYLFFRGPLPLPPICVLHTCDNRRCISPLHLFLGTRTENSADRDAKLRNAWGEQIAKAKLRATEVLTMRGLWADKTMTQVQLAKHFHVTEAHVSKIIRRKMWKRI